MIRFLPTPYPDELLYSVCARVHALMAHKNTKATSMALFGVESVSAASLLPTRLKMMIECLPPGHKYTVDQLIDQHTLLPFLRPFLPAERVRRLEDDMVEGVKFTVYMSSGLAASQIVAPLFLRFCPACVENDRLSFKEAYWHRVHQVPGIEVCAHHAVFLEQSTVRIRSARNRREYISAEQVLEPTACRSADQASPTNRVLLQLARDTRWLLEHPGLKPAPDAIRNRYCWLLAERGLMSYSGWIHKTKDLRNAVRMAFPTEVLRHFGSRYGERLDLEWVTTLLRKGRGIPSPLYHLLMMQFLCHTPESFFALPNEYAPFGAGPWPCLNPAAPHFHECVIEDCSVKLSRVPIGTFSCHSCGFIYSRRGPDRSPEDRNRRDGKVPAFGEIWNNRLVTLWTDPSVGLLRIAHHLGTDSITIKRQAYLLNLPYPRLRMLSSTPPILGGKRKGYMRQPLLSSHRGKWLAARAADPEGTINELRQKAPASYTYLRRLDRDWLQANLPLPHRRVNAKPYVNWESRDKELAARVPLVVEALLSREGRPKRIFLRSIGQALGLPLSMMLDKLPVTREVVATVLETREAFARRRVRWASAELAKRGSAPKFWQIMRKAAIRNTLRPAVEEAVNELPLVCRPTRSSSLSARYADRVDNPLGAIAASFTNNPAKKESPSK